MYTVGYLDPKLLHKIKRGSLETSVQSFESSLKCFRKRVCGEFEKRYIFFERMSGPEFFLILIANTFEMMRMVQNPRERLWYLRFRGCRVCCFEGGALFVRVQDIFQRNGRILYRMSRNAGGRVKRKDICATKDVSRVAYHGSK